MRIPTHVIYRLLLIAALATVVAAARPGFGIQAAALGTTGLEHPIVTIPPPPWVTQNLRGRVEGQPGSGEQTPSGPWARVRSGDALEPASTIRTGSRGQATLTRKQDVIQLDGATEIVLPERASAGTMVHHRQGNALYEVRPRADVRFQVVTPDLVATAKGTAFSVVVQEQFTAVMVSDGRVEVHATFTGERVELATGHMVLLLGPMDPLEVHQDPAEGLLPILRDQSRLIRESRRYAGRLVHRAAEDEVGAPLLYDFDSGTYLTHHDAGDEAMQRWSEGLEVGEARGLPSPHERSPVN